MLTNYPPPTQTATHPHPPSERQNSDGHRLYPSHKFFQFSTFGKGEAGASVSG